MFDDRATSVWLTRLFMRLVGAAVGAELLDLEPVGIVAAVLLGDVVAVFAHLARQSDLRPYVGTRRHVSSPCSKSRSAFDVPVAVGGLDPPTSRL